MTTQTAQAETLTDEVVDAALRRYDDEREADHERAEAKYEQKVATLFAPSDWTQSRIAEKLGVKQPQVARMLLFGRFLAFAQNIPSGYKSSKGGVAYTIPSDTNERTFRQHWEASAKNPKEELRFREVVKLMELKPKPRIHQVIARCSDGKFHTIKKIADMAGITVEEAKMTIGLIRRKPADARVEVNGSTKNPKYKVKKGSGKKIDLVHVMDRIEPLLQDLERQGKCVSAAEYAPATVLIAVHQLRKLLDEFSK